MACGVSTRRQESGLMRATIHSARAILARVGHPMTGRELAAEMGIDISHFLKLAWDWVGSAYLVRDGEFYTVGALAPKRSEYKPPRKPAPRRLVEGSDSWLVVQQLAHGPLTLTEVVDLLDVRKNDAERVLLSLERRGLVSADANVWILTDAGRALA
jgi:hypothetical protein